jgi:23S rRNA maturation mini-RNase III
MSVKQVIGPKQSKDQMESITDHITHMEDTIKSSKYSKETVTNKNVNQQRYKQPGAPKVPGP